MRGCLVLPGIYMLRIYARSHMEGDYGPGYRAMILFFTLGVWFLRGISELIRYQSEMHHQFHEVATANQLYLSLSARDPALLVGYFYNKL